MTQPAGSFSQAPAPKTTSNFYESDPGYQEALAREQLGIGAANANLASLIAQRIANYGDPHLAEMAGFGLDPQAAAFARQNYLSGNAELARIDKSHQLARQAIINRLAGHGLVFSGDTGYQTGLEDQSYGNNVYDAQQRVLADLLGYRTSNLNTLQGLHDAKTQALENAYQLALEHPEVFGYGQTDDSSAGGNPTPGSVGSSQPKAKTTTKSPKVKAVVSKLSNPYTTGQKARG